MSDLAEKKIRCPFCGEKIWIFVDCSEESQMYIEDCSVCCRPIQVQVACAEGELLSVQATRS